MKPVHVENDQRVSAAMRTSERAQLLALIAIVGSIFFLVSVVILHLLRPDNDPITAFISYYAVGPYGFLMTAAFLALGVSALALAAGLARAVTPSRWLWGGVFLLSVYAIGTCMLGIFTTDPIGNDSPPTTTGTIHGIAVLPTYLSIIIAALLLPQAYKHDEHWRMFYRTAVALGFVVLSSVVAVGLAGEQWGGLGQRMLITTHLVWLIGTALKFYRTTKANQVTAVRR